MLVYLPFIKNRMILKYKVTLLVLKLLNESYIFQCSFCDKLQLKKSIFFFIFENRVMHTQSYG